METKVVVKQGEPEWGSRDPRQLPGCHCQSVERGPSTRRGIKMEDTQNKHCRGGPKARKAALLARAPPQNCDSHKATPELKKVSGNRLDPGTGEELPKSKANRCVPAAPSTATRQPWRKSPNGRPAVPSTSPKAPNARDPGNLL